MGTNVKKWVIVVMSMRTDFRIESLLGDLKHGSYDARTADQQAITQVCNVIEAHLSVDVKPSADPTLTQ